MFTDSSRFNSCPNSMSFYQSNCLSRFLAIVMRVFLLTLFTGATSINAQVLFKDVSQAAGGFHTGESWGASWGDMDNDHFPDLFVSNHGMTSSIYRNNADGSFTDVTLKADLDKKLVKLNDKDTNLADIHAGTWADYDNDGDQDLFIARSSAGNQLYLFENNGSGKFRERSTMRGFAPDVLKSGRMAQLFDFSGDGKLDLTYSQNGRAAPVYLQQAGKFHDVTDKVGLTKQCQRNNFGLVSRLFNTGNLIYVCMEASQIVQKAYDTTTIPFADVSSSFDHTGTWSDAVLADIDNNGWLDMIVATGKTRPNGAEQISPTEIEGWLSVTNGQEKKVSFKADGNISVNLYSRKVASRNKSNGNQYDQIFIGNNGVYPTALPVSLNPASVAHQGIVQDRSPLGFYMGFNVSTQRWTLYLSAANNTDHVYFRVESDGLSGLAIDGRSGSDLPRYPKIFNNDGTQLVDIPGTEGLRSGYCGALAAADFDNDMDVDIYMVCRTSVTNYQNRMYWNYGNGTFKLGSNHGAEGITGRGIHSGAGTGEMAVTADYNADGFMDIFVTNGNRLFPHYRKDKFSGGGPDQLFENQGGNGNNWLELDMRGRTANRDGIGAKVTVRAGGIAQIREQTGQYHRSSQDHKRLHFGLGTNTKAIVVIRWPDGTRDVHNNVAVNRLYQAVQGGNLINRSPLTLKMKNTVATEGQRATVEISLTRAATKNVIVEYKTSNGTAFGVSDYTPLSGTLVFKPGEKVKSRIIRTLQDSKTEGTEFFTFNLRNPENAFIGTPSVNVDIRDND